MVATTCISIIIGFPGVIGAIDGTHVEIRKPSREPDGWVDRQGKRTMHVLAVCDADARFIYHCIGCPGAFHDARVLRLSGLPEKLDKVGMFGTQFHLVGKIKARLCIRCIVHTHC